MTPALGVNATSTMLNFIIKRKAKGKSSVADRLKLYEEGVEKSYTKTTKTEKREAEEKKRQTDKLPGNLAAADNSNSQEPRTSRFCGPVVQPDPLKDKNPGKGSDSDEEYVVPCKTSH